MRTVIKCFFYLLETGGEEINISYLDSGGVIVNLSFGVDETLPIFESIPLPANILANYYKILGEMSRRMEKGLTKE